MFQKYYTFNGLINKNMNRLFQMISKHISYSFFAGGDLLAAFIEGSHTCSKKENSQMFTVFIDILTQMYSN